MRGSRWELSAAALPLLLVICLNSAHAAPSKPAMELVLLGTGGGPTPLATRSYPASLLIVNNEPYLIDAGNGVARQLMLAGVAVTRIGQIFITHNHDDHNADLGTLMGLEWSIGRSVPITAHAPRGTKAMMDGFLKFFAENRDIRLSQRADIKAPPEQVFKIEEIQAPGRIFEDANVKVDAIENCHFDFKPGTPAAGRAKSYAFRFKTADKTIVFSGDTGPCPGLADFAKGADILVHEVILLAAPSSGAPPPPPPQQQIQFFRLMTQIHTTPEDVGKLAAKAKIKMVVLNHIGRDDLPDSAYIDGVKKYYSGPVVVGKDLMRF